MFKFRSSLVNQLLNHVQINPEWNSLEDIEQPALNHEVISTSDKRPLTSRRHSAAWITNAKRKQVQSMLLRLKKANLEVLLNAIQSGTPGDCVFIPVCTSSTSTGIPPHLLLAQVFRWPDLQFEWELKRLEFYCQALHDFDQNNRHQKDQQDFCQPPKLYECCNPYHWTRIILPTDPPYNADGKLHYAHKKVVRTRTEWRQKSSTLIFAHLNDDYVYTYGLEVTKKHTSTTYA